MSRGKWQKLTKFKKILKNISPKTQGNNKIGKMGKIEKVLIH
jgi:hypothetical protein